MYPMASSRRLPRNRYDKLEIEACKLADRVRHNPCNQFTVHDQQGALHVCRGYASKVRSAFQVSSQISMRRCCSHGVSWPLAVDLLYTAVYIEGTPYSWIQPERAISPAARTTLHQGGSNFACGANYPHQAIKGGYFVFVWRVGT